MKNSITFIPPATSAIAMIAMYGYDYLTLMQTDGRATLANLIVTLACIFTITYTELNWGLKCGTRYTRYPKPSVPWIPLIASTAAATVLVLTFALDTYDHDSGLGALLRLLGMGFASYLILMYFVLEAVQSIIHENRH